MERRKIKENQEEVQNAASRHECALEEGGAACILHTQGSDTGFLMS
jgi:hypothetical protein